MVPSERPTRDGTNTPVAAQMIELSTGGSYRSTFYRLGALRLIELPLHAYKVAGHAVRRESGSNDRKGLPERLISTLRNGS